MSLLTKFNLALILVFGLALVPAGWIANDLLQKSARTQVIENARIMMETALAVTDLHDQADPAAPRPPARDDVPPAVGPRLLGDRDLQRPPEDESRVRLQGGDAQPDESPQPDGRLGGRPRPGLPQRRREEGDHRRARDATGAGALPLSPDPDQGREVPRLPRRRRTSPRPRRSGRTARTTASAGS